MHFEPVTLLYEQSQVQVATLDLGEVQVIGPLIPSRQLLEEEDFGDEPPEKWVAQEERLQIPPDVRELLSAPA